MATLTRALKALQVLPARIIKETGGLVPAVLLIGHDSAPTGYKSRDEYIKAQEAKVNSVLGLIDRQAELAEAVAVANATTKVKLNGYPRELSIAGAVKLRIALKATMAPLFAQLRGQLAIVGQKLETEELRYQTRLDEMLGKLTGKDARTRTEEVEGTQAVFRKTQGPMLVQGISPALTEILEERVKLIDEIDLVLSEMNGKVEIAVEDK